MILKAMKNDFDYIPESELNKVLENQINEGAFLNGNSFDFNFIHDEEKDIIHLCNNNLEKKEYLGIKYYYYAYYFTKYTPSTIRTKFIQTLRFHQEGDKEVERFISSAIEKLDKEIVLPLYDAIIVPESKSNLAREISIEAYKYACPNGGVYTFELIKDLPSRINFDYESFTNQVLNGFINGKPRYTEKEKEEVLCIIENLINDIHKLDYFSIARNIKNKKYEPFITNYLKFASDREESAYKAITISNVLIIDDIATSGTTLQQILKAIRTINNTKEITIFTLIGKKDLS